MNCAKSLTLVGLAFFGVAACSPKPAEPDVVAAPAEASNSVATDVAPATGDISNAVAADAVPVDVAPVDAPTNAATAAADDPRANPDRRAPAAVTTTEAPSDMPK